MTLKQLPKFSRARVTALNLAQCHLLRLSELGLRPGCELAVVSKGAFGGVVINVAGTRMAIDHRSAKLIEVETVTSK
ncbi:MAG: FeoA family protein [Actinomycetaceae bacterium]|nr:FeoA family protein [Actinomycetaceae bacterium]